MKGQGVLDMGTSSTQNASSVAPWLNAIDFPYMFQSAGQLYHFFFNPKSDRLFREVYRKKNRMDFSSRCARCATSSWA